MLTSSFEVVKAERWEKVAAMSALEAEKWRSFCPRDFLQHLLPCRTQWKEDNAEQKAKG
jgi:hypothetical protein